MSQELFLLTHHDIDSSVTFGVFDSIEKAREYIQKRHTIEDEKERNDMFGWSYEIRVVPEDEYDTSFYCLKKTKLNLGV